MVDIGSHLTAGHFIERDGQPEGKVIYSVQVILDGMG
jgi:hypothetical protein